MPILSLILYLALIGLVVWLITTYPDARANQDAYHRPGRRAHRYLDRPAYRLDRLRAGRP